MDFFSSMDISASALSAERTRMNLISSNLANVETPGYTPTDHSFEAELKSALNKGGKAGSTTNPRHIPLKGGSAALELVVGQSVELPGKGTGPDGNGVELESEMGRMAENQIMYNASVQLLTKKFEMMKQAIRGTL